MEISSKGIQIIALPKIEDRRGNLSVIENEIIPFEIKRVYYVYDIPSGSVRGGHAHKNLRQFLIAVSGSFDVVVNNGEEENTITLNKPNVGLLINSGVWRELKNFSSGSVCLVVASEIYIEDDYIRDFDEFIKYVNRK
ncbi:FdtA/QdtA family cupin domain-containing protein [Flavobacterium sp. Fl-318]|uniref:FdtA/QdtA family cupin domain-containing protein n=1 Tax=Flavobacterium cupriresistens TaxID=2893885 RepID=A0ABU4R7C3_9FLAO|nr:MULTISPECIES: FdtA/QdtA family cupin domain-containing protein [unclassified Flavobacterium]MDX6188489.1 FdtA/QdtA family cupin domain-containing protein [Flavobacterium sp. Fl-318]UFH44840.1 FdtA/QdtA family cupin domain-containing protein [Flavobacterium sp. F-323]